MTTAITARGGGFGTAASFSGSLSKTPLAAVHRRIAVEERSGDLQVTTPDFTKTVYFDRGFVVFASSDVKDDRLGESMIHAGRISRHEFALASMLMKTTQRKFGEVLVEAGIIPEEELGRYVAAQVNRIVLSLFSAKEGEYRFDERPCSVPVELMVSLSVYRILIDGVRRMSRKSLVLAGLPPLDTKLAIVDQPPFTLDVDKLRPDEKSVLRAARDGSSIQAIVDAVGGHEGVALRACYGLLSGGILEPVAPEPKPRLLRVQEETGTFVLSEIRRKVGVPEEPQAEAPPPPKKAPPPAPRVEPPRASAPPADAFTLSDLYNWVGRLWGYVRGWFGGASETTVSKSRAEARERVATPAAAEPPALSAPSSPESVESAKPTTEPVGVPSWSLEDAPEDRPVGDGVGVPSWSLKGETSEEEDRPAEDALGVPRWSMKDAPEDVPASRPPEPDPEPSPSSERLEPPSWSILAEPEERDEEVLEVEPAPAAVDAPVDDEPMDAMDSELFIEGAVADDDASSLLHQIPVEEVALDDSVEPEIEIEVELEEAERPSPQRPAASVPSAPEPRVEPAPHVVEPPEPVPRPAPSPATGTSKDKDYTPERGDARAAAHEQAMLRMKQSGGEARLLRDVKLHFRLRDWQGAVPLLEQLVAISPGKALYRGMLARAMSRDPATRKDAEEHYIEALRLSPQDPELHYWLGLYYKSFGLKARAITEFRTTLRINPKHEGARKQLGGGKKDDALGSVMKKLFG